MPHDVHGRLLKVGDRVLILALVTHLDEGEDYCNVSLESVYGRRPDGLKEQFSGINTGVLQLHPMLADEDEPARVTRGEGPATRNVAQRLARLEHENEILRARLDGHESRITALKHNVAALRHDLDALLMGRTRVPETMVPLYEQAPDSSHATLHEAVDQAMKDAGPGGTVTVHVPTDAIPTNLPAQPAEKAAAVLPAPESSAPEQR